MSYQVIARKWRPQNFDEVVFQDHVSRTIRNSIKLGRISHAYIFSGPRGVGKTTMARILAKALNCKEGPTPEPCGVCENCLEIKQGNSFDVIEIDGASNNGVENIRELRENVNFAPAKSKYKIYIIDEVHMVTTAAFNALLKTLEEPPSHVIFIFATTEIHKVPDTILSRCQKYFFKKIPIDDVVNHLKSIVAKEGYAVSDEALYPVARIADGSMRDAQSLLEQVISFSQSLEGGGDGISEEDALSILGMVPTDSYVRILGFLIEGDDNSLINEVNSIVSMGVEIPRYVAGLMDSVRAIRLIKKGVDLVDVLGLSEREVLSLNEIGNLMGDEELSRIFQVLSDLAGNLRFSTNERIYLEMALLDIVSALKSPSLAEIIKKLEDGGGSGRPAQQSPALKKQSAPVQEKKTPSRGVDLKECWSNFLKDLEEQKKPLFYILRPARIETDGSNIRISYPSGIDVQNYTKTLDDRAVKFIENNLSLISGGNIKVEMDFSQSPAEDSGADKPVNANLDMPETSGEQSEDAPVPEAEMVHRPESADYEIEGSAVTKLKEAFHGQVIDKGEKKC